MGIIFNTLSEFFGLPYPEVPSNLRDDIISEYCIIHGFTAKNLSFIDHHNLEYYGSAYCLGANVVVTLNWKFGLYQILKTIGHELVHVEQFQSKKLQCQFNVDRRSINKYYFSGEMYDLEEVAYKNRPWEIEAFARQDEMLKIFLRHCSDELLNRIKSQLSWIDWMRLKRFL